MKKTMLYLVMLLLMAPATFAQVGINNDGSNPDNSAMLDVKSTDKGLFLPRMTTAERDLISSPANSLLIFNTTTQCFEAWNAPSSTWVAFGCIGCAPTGVSASAAPNPICVGSDLTLTGVATDATAWSWTGPNGYTSSSQNPTITGITTAGAGVYTLTASNNCGSVQASTSTVTVNAAPTTANAGSDINPACGVTTATLAGNTPTVGTGTWSVVSGTATITTPSSPTSGLTDLVVPGTATLRWTISNSPCNDSYDDVVITTTECFNCGTSTVTFTYNGSSVTYGTVVGQNSTCWLDRNLGASQVATSSTDADSYGDLYQWGRAADGHESRTSSTTTTLATSNTPGHGNFITNGISSPYGWRNPQNDNLWQGVSGTNNPCPSGYRLPTGAEWEAERTSWSSNNAAGAFASPLKLPVAGHRNDSSGSLNVVGSEGFYWSSTVHGTNSRLLFFSSSNANIFSDYRARGYSVRCIKDL